MTRDFAAINVTIWQDSDWRAVPFPAQYLYQMLWTHPTLNYCGVTDWRPARLTALTQMFSVDLVHDLADTLQARHFIVPDPDTEEVLLRSYVRWDGLMRKPRLSISWVKAYAATASNTLRGVIVSEGQKLRKREPDLSCWGDERVAEVLENEAIDVRDLAVPSDPFAIGLPSSLISVCDAFAANATSGLRSPTPSLAPSPTPHSPAKPSSSTDDGFDAWWALYPKKVEKKAAQAKWKTTTKKVSSDELMAGLRRFVAYVERERIEPKFIKGPEVWLNKGCWADEHPGVQQHTQQVSSLPWTPEPPPREIENDPQAVERWYEAQVAQRKAS